MIMMNLNYDDHCDLDYDDHGDQCDTNDPGVSCAHDHDYPKVQNMS